VCRLGSAGRGFAARPVDFETAVLFHQAADRLAARNSTNGLDIGAKIGCLLGNDRERFQVRVGELGVDLFRCAGGSSVAVLGRVSMDDPASDLFHAEALRLVPRRKRFPRLTALRTRAG